MRIEVITLANTMFIARFSKEVETRIDKILTIREKNTLASTTLISCDAFTVKKREILA